MNGILQVQKQVFCPVMSSCVSVTVWIVFHQAVSPCQSISVGKMQIQPHLTSDAAFKYQKDCLSQVLNGVCI